MSYSTSSYKEYSRAGAQHTSVVPLTASPLHMIPAKLSATSHTHSSMQPAWLTCDPQALKLYPSLHASAHNPPTHTSCPKTTVFPPAPFPALTLLPHACLLALAQPALLTLATHVHVHLTLAAILADVLCTLDDAATEEALAAFTAQHVVVEAGGLVPTDAAHFISQHLRGWALLPLQGGIFYRNEQYRGKGEGGRKKKKKRPHTWGKHGVCSWLPHSLQ